VRAANEHTSDLLFADREFSWQVSPAGHSWIDAPNWCKLERGERLLVGFGPFPEDGPQPRVYNPAKTPDLYRRLATTAPTERGILEFADKWGNLTRRGIYQITTPERLHMERLTDWQRTIANLSLAVQVHDWSAARDEGVLRRHFQWKQLKEWSGWAHGVMAIEADHVTLTKHSDPVLVARVFLTGWVNQHLGYRGHVAPLTHLRLEDRSIVLRIMPLSLEGLVWWQLAQTMQGQSDYQICAQCPNPIRVGAGCGARTDTRFCSTRCKQRYHEERGRRARQLRADGKTLAEMAKELDTTQETVKRWLTPRKRRGKP